MKRPTSKSTLFPYTTLFRSPHSAGANGMSTARSLRDKWARGETAFGVWAALPDAFAAELMCVLGGERVRQRSEEHTSELQSHSELVCRLLLEKKKTGPTETT